MNEDNFDLEESVLDFSLHYNSRAHTRTKFTPYEIMENRFDQNILKQVRDNTLKSRKDRKIKEFEEGQNILISNYVIQPDVNRKYLNNYKPRYQKKGEDKEFFKVKGKNYWGEKKLLQSKNCKQVKQPPHIKRKIFVEYIKNGFFSFFSFF